MFVIRNVFKCKPGQAKNIIEKFKAAHRQLWIDFDEPESVPIHRKSGNRKAAPKF